MKTNTAPTSKETTPFLCDDGKDVVVPLYKPCPNQSVDQAAAALGLRALARREARKDVVAVIADGGRHFGCVKK